MSLLDQISALNAKAQTIIDLGADATDEQLDECAKAQEESSTLFTKHQRLQAMEAHQAASVSALDLPNPRRITSDRADSIVVGEDLVREDPYRGLAKHINVPADDFGGLAAAHKHNAALGQLATMVFQAGPNEQFGALQASAGTGMEQGVTARGGLIVPPAVSRKMWEGAAMASNSLLQFTNDVPIDPGNESIEFPKLNETSRADGSRQGGIQGYWGTELGKLTSSTVALDGVKWTPNELDVYCFVTDKLLRNSPIALGSWLGARAADAFNFKIGDGIISGNGAGKPMGVLNAACTVTVAKETSQAAATIKTENVDKMWDRLHINAYANAVWFVNQATGKQLRAMSRSVGTAGELVYTPPGGVSQAPYGSLYGRPVMPLEYCSALGTKGDIILADLGFYGFCIKGGINSAESIHLKFDFKQTAFRWGMEVDGQSWLKSAVTPYKGSDTTSPFVTLATRA